MVESQDLGCPVGTVAFVGASVAPGLSPLDQAGLRLGLRPWARSIQGCIHVSFRCEWVKNLGILLGPEG